MRTIPAKSKDKTTTSSIMFPITLAWLGDKIMKNVPKLRRASWPFASKIFFERGPVFRADLPHGSEVCDGGDDGHQTLVAGHVE